MDIIYLSLKGLLLLGIARSYVLFEPLQKSWFFLALLYTAGVAALSWVFFLSMRPQIPDRDWQLWLLKTFILVIVYFKLLSKFDEGFLFWIIFLGGWIGLVWF